MDAYITCMYRVYDCYSVSSFGSTDTSKYTGQIEVKMLHYFTSAYLKIFTSDDRWWCTPMPLNAWNSCPRSQTTATPAFWSHVFCVVYQVGTVYYKITDGWFRFLEKRKRCPVPWYLFFMDIDYTQLWIPVYCTDVTVCLFGHDFWTSQGIINIDQTCRRIRVNSRITCTENARSNFPRPFSSIFSSPDAQQRACESKPKVTWELLCTHRKNLAFETRFEESGEHV